MLARLPSSLLACALVVGCGVRESSLARDDGPCGRGKARSCQCDDGSKGIAQCLSGGDWGECFCNPTTYDFSPDAGTAGATEEVDRSELDDCESTFDFRAHAVGNFSEPFHVAARNVVLPGGQHQHACFYFHVPYVLESVALGFSALLYETAGVRSWALYGLDSSTHPDGEVSSCNGAEPGAYLLAAFAPGVGDVRMPADVGLSLPHGERAGLVLDVQYDGAPSEVLDRTGIRVCAARAGSRKHTASVHFTGSQGICIPPGARDYEVAGVCKPRSDLGTIHVLDVWPAMHRHGKRMQVTLLRANGAREVLHDAPFVFDEQQRFEQRDVTMQLGDSLETRCYYDNDSLLPIAYGDGVDQETCFGFITAWPAGVLASNPLGALGSALGIEPERSCLNPADLLLSCVAQL